MLSQTKKQAIILVLPALIYFFIFALYPMVENFILTFQTETLNGSYVWSGFTNYFQVFKIPHLDQIFENTVIYTLAVPFLDILLAIPLASFMRRLNKPFLLPVILLSAFIPLVTAAVMWVFMLNPIYGFIYYIDKVDLFTTPWSIVLIDVWSSLPLATLIIYSGLKAIPPHIEEAAHMDGLIGFRKLARVDLPYIKASILSATVLMILYGSFTFDPIYIAKTVSPPFATLDIAYFSYSLFFTGEAGQAAVLMVIMTLVSTLISILFVKLTLSEKRRRTRFSFRFLPNREIPKPVAALLTALYLIFFLLPFAWLILESFKTPKEIIAIPPAIIPSVITFSDYLYSFIVGEPYFITSMIVSLGTAVLVFIIGAPAAYSISRHRTGGLKIIAFILFVYSLPTVIFLIPVHNVIQSAGLINGWLGLIIAYPVFVLPITIWLLYNFYATFPKHLDEAANIDGMNVYSSFYRVILRLSGDGISVTLLYSFIISWGALIFPLALTYSQFNMNFLAPFGAQTVTIFIGGTIGHEAFNYGVLSAASVISLIPSIILIYFTRRRIDKLWRVGGTVG
jgi:multiple sugar transport system permease protein